MFNIRFEYPNIFENIFKIDNLKKRRRRTFIDKRLIEPLNQVQKSKIYKIKYQLNILPSILEEKGELIEAISDSDELDIFRT